jgi:hypothetical protein
MHVKHDDTIGYSIIGLSHAQARGLDLLLSENHTGNRRHAVYMPNEQRAELDKLLTALLPVLAGFTKRQDAPE